MQYSRSLEAKLCIKVDLWNLVVIESRLRFVSVRRTFSVVMIIVEHATRVTCAYLLTKDATVTSNCSNFCLINA